MHIGIDIRLIGKQRTGDEVVIFNLVKNLAKIDDKNEYVLFTDIADEEVLKNIGSQLGINGKNNFKIVALTPALSQGARGIWKFFNNRFAWNFWTLPMFLRKNPVDVYHTQYITPWNVSKKIKIVTIVHDISFNFFPQMLKFSDLFFLKLLIPISLRRADKIVGVSEFTRNEIIKFYKINSEKVEYVHNSISDDFLTDDIPAERLREVKEKYKLPEKFILYVGTLQPRKNIPMLIEAYAKMRNDIGNIKLVICGNRKANNYDRKIDEALKKNDLENEVIFPGFIEEQDKKSIFKLAHVFVFPSLYEGFGIPMLEAMSQKVPVLASNIPSLKEVGQDGALYFDISSLDDFSKKLYDICINNDLRNELIQKGATRCGFFSWNSSTGKMLAIYERMGHNQ